MPHELHDKQIDMYKDIFQFGGCLFFLIESGRINYVEIYSIISERLESSVIPLVKKEIRKYKARGLKICGVHTDNQFNYETFSDAIKPAILIPYAENEDFGISERRNRTIKERVREVITRLP